jgi:hypothetical protein
MSPDFEPYIPPSEVGHLELLSDRTSPTGQMLKELDERLMRNDAVGPKENISASQSSDLMLFDSDRIGELFSPLKDLKQLPPSPGFKRKKPIDHKVEEPLTPRKPDWSHPWKAKKELFQKVSADLVPQLLPFEDLEDPTFGDIDRFFAETMQPIAEAVDRRIEQEQLQEADATHRATVPIMDFTRPAAPWKTAAGAVDGKNSQSSASRFLKSIKANHLEKHRWPSLGETERNLQWDPFPSGLARVAKSEEILDADCATWISRPECLDSCSMVWKRDGLRLLDEGESDFDDIEEGKPRDPNDISTLTRKRKLDLECDYVDGESTATVNSMDRDKLSGNSGFDSFALGNMDSFLSTLGPDKRPKLTVAPYFPPKCSQELAKPAMELLGPLQPQKPTLPIPCPPITPTSSTFILSPAIFTNLRLLRQLRTLQPAATFLERDFTLHADPTTTPEADLLLSPTTALLHTTLALTLQRPLPGSTAARPFHARLLVLAPRYTTLLVLVSQNAFESPPPGLDAAACTALAELVAFCATLDGDVRVLVAAGREADVAPWVAWAMGVFGSATGALAEETLWEVWLRRAGMGAFAAQAVLGALNGGGSAGGDGRGGSADGDAEAGLAAFVRMEARERERRFGPLLGGTAVLRRVGRRMDERW